MQAGHDAEAAQRLRAGHRLETAALARLPAESPAAALLWACLVLPLTVLFSTPAQAQAAATFVSNTGQPDTAAGYYTHEEYRAQEFTTGDHAAGYRLSAIAVDIGRSCSIASAFALHESITYANGLEVPGTKVVDLTGSASSSGRASFIPANATVLSSASKYFVVFKTATPATRLDCKVHRTLSSNFDGGVASGWAIARRAVFSSNSGSTWRNTGGSPEDPLPAIQIAVRGTTVTTQPPVTPPAMAKSDQTLSGFRYSASSVAFGSAAPTVTAPSGARTTLSYSATPATVCTVNASTGALTLAGAGSCEITATAASTVNYNEATATYTVTVNDDGTVSSAVALSVNPDSIVEGAGATTVIVTGTLNGSARNEPTTLTLSVGAPEDTATEGIDYTVVSGVALTIDAGQTSGSATFTLTPADDGVVEGDETLTVCVRQGGYLINR